MFDSIMNMPLLKIPFHANSISVYALIGKETRSVKPNYKCYNAFFDPWAIHDNDSFEITISKKNPNPREQ